MAELAVRKPIVVVGAGGFGRETVDVIDALNVRADEPPWLLLGVVDDAPSEQNLQRLRARNIKYLGSCDQLIAGRQRPSFVIGIGSPMVRRELAEKLELEGFEAASLVHPDASIGSETFIGDGCVILAGARLTTNITLGRHVHINPNATVGHDTIIGDYVSLNPACSISGDCTVEMGALIGVGAVVLNQLKVGSGATVGASACVVRNVSPISTVKGVPAR